MYSFNMPIHEFRNHIYKWKGSSVIWGVGIVAARPSPPPTVAALWCLCGGAPHSHCLPASSAALATSRSIGGGRGMAEPAHTLWLQPVTARNCEFWPVWAVGEARSSALCIDVVGTWAWAAKGGLPWSVWEQSCLPRQQSPRVDPRDIVWVSVGLHLVLLLLGRRGTVMYKIWFLPHKRILTDTVAICFIFVFFIVFVNFSNVYFMIVFLKFNINISVILYSFS